ncbi:Kinesin-like protein [Phytophthora palmivora]|uniref:Kinesin-like protein n=1 Tax=Phytophthora palmivora TaxID=4796 RepID=A0A2P4YTZ3_9STRA|nr:Kinesin-like protein [Phytophthora palmivora]
MASAQRCVFTDKETIEVKTSEGSPQKFTFDHVFGEEDNQKTVFESVALPVVQDIMDGYNATIFAYGQTSSGKTYTMEGANIDHPELQGIIPRTATEIFNNVMNADENMEFIVKVSYIEIYMERIRDLLDPYKSKVNLQVREDAQRGIFVEGMTEMCVTSDEELLAAMRAGAANRAVAATGMNEGSSRSHSVFMVTLFQRNLENQATKAGKLYLVDLAGSEMVRKTGATGRQLEEAKTINKSLSALGMVINALTDSNITHVPYRDSKLTRVLQESLGGNSRTNLIINVSPSSFNSSETISTLRFGMRAKSIKNKAVVNEQRSVAEYEALLAAAEKKIAKQQTYIIALEARLSGKEIPDGVHVRDETDAIGDTIADDTQGIEKTEGVDSNVDTVDIQLKLADTSTLEAPPSPSARAGRALAELQEKVTQLDEELSEEKQESMRRGEEIRLLTAKLDEHIQALETQRILSEELQRVKELQEKTLEEKIRQRETLYAELRTDFDRLNFDHKELLIHSETIQSEYDALLNEMPASATGGKLAAAAEKIAQAEQSTEEKSQDIAGENAAEGQEQKSGDEAATETTDESESQQYLDLKTRYTALEAELREYEKEYLALKHATDHEKARLQEDIDRKAIQIRDLEAQADRAGASTGEGGSTPSSPTGSTSSSGMSARERQHMRSIQQKLEQLVAVHRQLLRKYASLELELSEAKKKLALRDERIKQVEANNRIMAGNMRAQAEKHVEELTHLRDQIADFRGAQRSHFEAQLNHTNAALVAAMGSTDTGVIKTLRGGSIYSGDGVIRPIRGGGRRKTQLGEAAMGTTSISGVSAASADAGVPSSGFLTRLFGKTN